MPIGFGGFGGGGDGGGLHTRRPPDIFNEPAAATIAVARTARNTYFTANLGDLAQFQGDQSLAIVLRVTGDPDVFQTYAAGQEGLAYDQTQWLDRTDAVDGPQGDQGRFELFIHTNSAGTPSPATPVGGTYVVGTGVFTPPAGTTEAPTNPGVGEDVYLSQAVVDPLTEMGTVTPIWSLWIERAHVSSGITSVSSDGTLAGIGIAADPLSVVNPITAVNPTAAFTDRATSLQVGATVYELPDDVLDVTGVGLPGLTADNYQQIFIDHDTPRVWVGHRDITGNARGTWNPTPIVADDYIGTFITPPAPTDAGQQYYDQTYHSWFAVAGGLGSYYWFQDSFGDIYPSSDWLGEQASDDAALHVIRTNFDPTRRYLYYLIGSTSPLGIRELDVPTYVAPTTPRTVYVAEPISAPAGVGSITGLTAGGGITLNGGAGTVSSGVVAFGIDPSRGAFPTIPLVKGGTGATTAVAARTALGLGTAAVLDTGVADGDIPLLGSSGVLDPDRMAVSGAVDTVLTYQTGGTTAWLAYAGLTSVTSGNSLSGLGTVALPLNVVGQTNHLASSTRYSPGGIIDATIGELGARDANNGHMISFEIPAGVPNDSTAISLRVNSNTSRGIFDHTETRIIGSDLQGVGQWITVQRILTEFYTLGTLGAAVGGVDSYATAVDVTFTSGSVGVSITGNHSFAAISDSVNLGLGTAAVLDTGIGDGNIPLLDSGGLLDDARIPGGIMRDSEFAAAFVTALTSAVTGNIETNIAVTVSSTGKLDFVSGSGITSVASDASLVGLGTAGNVLGIADEGVQESNLAVFGAPSTTEDQILAWDYANTRMEWQVGTGSAGVQGAFPIFIFRNAGTVPATPTGGSYVVSTGVLTPPANWTVAPSTPGTGEETYVSRYQVNPLIHTGTITPTWSAAYEEAGSGLVSVAHDTAFTGDGTSTNPIALAIAGAAFPVIPLAKGGTGGTDAGTARTGIGLETAVTAIGESGGNLTVEYADGSTFNVPLEEGGSFRGEGHEVFVAGDTFLQLPNGTRFEFGDYAIVDDILYIYNQGAERTGVQPDNIATQANFTEIPRILPNPTGTAVGAVTSLGIGDEIYTVADPLTANFETLTNMSVGSISPSDIFFFRDINVDGNRKLSIGALRQYLDDVIDVTGTGLPVLTSSNYRKIFIDHDTPRVWVGHREVRAATGAQGTFVAHTDVNYHGVHSGNGPAVPQSAGQYYYNRSGHTWYVTYLFNTTYVWASGSFADLFGATARWLGEQPDAATAVGLIQNFDTNNIYVYYRTAIAFRTVEVLTNNTYQGPVTEETHYTSEPLGTGFGMSGLTGVLTATTSGLMGGAVSGDANLSLNIDGLDDFQTTEADSADELILRDASSSTNPFRSMNIGRFVGRMAGNTSTLSESSGRLSVADGGIGTTQLADAGITEPKLFATNDPTVGQVLSYAGGTDVNFTWIAATGGGTSTVSPGTGIDVTTSGSDFEVALEPQFQTPHISGGTLTLSLDGASGFLITLNRTDVPDAGQSVGDTITFTMPDPLNAPSGVTATSTTRFAVVGGTLYFIVDPAGSAIRFGDFRAGRLYTLRFWNTSNGWVLVEPPIGDIQGITTSAVSGLIGGAGFGTPALLVRPDRATALSESALATDDEFLFYNTSVSATEKATLAQILAGVAGITDTNDFVDTAALTISALDLTLTLGRTGTLADVVSAALTLPDPTLADFSPRTNMSSTSISHSDIFFFRDVSESSNANRKLTVGNLATFMAGSTTLSASNGVLSVAADGILRANLSRPLQAYFDTAPGVSYNSGTGVLDLDLTALYGPDPLDGDTYIFAAPASISGGSTSLSIRIFSGSTPIPLVRTDNTPVVESDLTSAQKYVATLVNDRWFLISGLAGAGNTNDYVDTAALTLNATNQLVATIGRTGSLADIVTTPLTLPIGVTTTISTTDTSGLTSATVGSAVAIAINADRLTSLSDAAVATDDELILYNESASSTERVTIAEIASVIGTSAGVSRVRSADSNIGVSPTTGDVRLTLADQVNAWTWYNIGVADFASNLITIEAPSSYNAEKRGDFYSFHLSAPSSATGDVSIRRNSTATTWPLRDGIGRRMQAEDLHSGAGGALYQVLFNGFDAYYISNFPQEFDIPDNGNARAFIIPISSAGGTVNDITITTGQNITLQNGDEFYFVAPTATNTGDVTITVDSNTTLELVKSNGLGARIQMAPGETRRHGYDLIRFTRGFVDEFTWESAIQGNAAAYNVGILEGNLVTLNSDTVIDSNRLGTGGAAAEVLTWASGTATWEPIGASLSGNQRTFVVPDSGVGGTVDVIELTTGLSITLIDGDEFRFTPSAVNTGAVSIAVDGSTAGALYHYRNDSLRLFGAGDLLDEPAIATYDAGGTRFLWRPAAASTSSYYEVGVGNRDIAILGMNGTFAPARFGLQGSVNRVLTWEASAAVWADLPAGVSPITAVTTSTTSGLQGGGTNGALALSLDLGNLGEVSTSDFESADRLLIYDESDTTNRAKTIQLGRLAAHLASGTASGLGSGAGVLNIAALGVTAARLAAASVQPDKLGVTVAGTAGQVLSYASDTQFTWVDPAGGGGTGDIEGITTLATSGLAGGAVTGTPSLSLDLSGLAEANGQFITSGTDRLYIENRDETPYQQQISIFELQQALMIATSTAHQNPAEQDRFFVSDVSYQGGTPRYIRWDTLRTRFTNDATLDWADAANEEDDFAPTRKTVAESLAAVTEPQLVISNNPSADDVLSWNGTAMTWVSTTPTPATHTSYTATGADETFTEAEFTGTQGNSGTGNSLTVEDWTGMQYAAFARPTSAGTITELYWHAQGGGRGNNQIGAWTVESATLDIGGDPHYVVRSNGPQSFISGLTFVIEVA